MFRPWWIPEGCVATEGTYVYYDHEAMMGIILLEAQRAGAVVIGEDLVSWEPVRLPARPWRLGYLRRVVRKEGGGWPLRPEHYRDALAAVNIHDLPPTLGYIRGFRRRCAANWSADDIETVRAADRLEA